MDIKRKHFNNPSPILQATSRQTPIPSLAPTTELKAL